MHNREYVNPFDRPRDVGNAREKSTNSAIEHPEGHTTTPMNHRHYSGETLANKRHSFNTAVPSVPPGGRTPAGYKPTIYRSDTAVFRESDRIVKRDQALGKVIKPTDHPNKDLNKIYG